MWEIESVSAACSAQGDEEIDFQIPHRAVSTHSRLLLHCTICKMDLVDLW